MTQIQTLFLGNPIQYNDAACFAFFLFKIPLVAHLREGCPISSFGKNKISFVACSFHLTSLVTRARNTLDGMSKSVLRKLTGSRYASPPSHFNLSSTFTRILEPSRHCDIFHTQPFSIKPLNSSVHSLLPEAVIHPPGTEFLKSASGQPS